MKKFIMIFVALLSVSGAFAFQAGDVLMGGDLEVATFRAWDGERYILLGIIPQFSGFVTDHITADLTLNCMAIGCNNRYVATATIGAGSRYFLNKMYAGIDFHYEMGGDRNYYSSRGFEYGGMLLTPKVGTLAAVVRDVYLDLQVYYMLGIGDIKVTGQGDRINNLNMFGIRVGFVVHPNSKQ